MEISFQIRLKIEFIKFQKQNENMSVFSTLICIQFILFNSLKYSLRKLFIPMKKVEWNSTASNNVPIFFDSTIVRGAFLEFTSRWVFTPSPLLNLVSALTNQKIIEVTNNGRKFPNRVNLFVVRNKFSISPSDEYSYFSARIHFRN